MFNGQKLNQQLANLVLWWRH